ncbi:zf-HC2 domain-containing protein [Chitinophaga agrisoli]
MRKTGCNCRQATAMIERQQAGSLTILQRLRLRRHLSRCPPCRFFKRQTRLLGCLVRDRRYPAAAIRPDNSFIMNLLETLKKNI